MGRRVAREATRPNHKVCVMCDVEKPFEEFPQDPKRPDRLYSYCKPCKAAFMRAATKRWKERNPEKRRRGEKRTNLRKFARRQEWRSTSSSTKQWSPHKKGAA